MKTCSRCSEVKPLTEYYTRTSAGKSYPQSHCKKCEVARTKARKEADPEYANRYRAKTTANQCARQKRHRAEGINREKHLMNDCRGTDKRKGLTGNLTLEFIKERLLSSCTYCGHADGMITLDRIDNEIGHTMTNVVPACVPCNLTRGNMPYDAWMVVAKGMREAREAGLFEGWKPYGKRV